MTGLLCPHCHAMYIVIIRRFPLSGQAIARFILLYLFTNGKIPLLFNASRKNVARQHTLKVTPL
jgi:hypothetical protein